MYIALTDGKMGCAEAAVYDNWGRVACHKCCAASLMWHVNIIQVSSPAYSGYILCAYRQPGDTKYIQKVTQIHVYIQDVGNKSPIQNKKYSTNDSKVYL